MVKVGTGTVRSDTCNMRTGKPGGEWTGWCWRNEGCSF